MAEPLSSAGEARESLLARHAVGVVAALTAAWLALAIGFADPRAVGMYHDDGIYVVAGQSLAAGEGYRIASLPGAPYETKYPILLPAILAVVWKIAPSFPANAFALQLPILLCGAALLPLTFAVARRALRLPVHAALAATALLALCPWLLALSRWVLTEVPFAVVAMGAILLAEREAGPEAREGRRWLGLGVLAGLGLLLKSAGVTLVAALAAQALLARRWRSLACLLGGFAPLAAGWLAWSRWRTATPAAHLLDHYLSYQTSFFSVASLPALAAGLRSVGLNLVAAGRASLEFTPLPVGVPEEILLVVVLALLAAALTIAWRRGRRSSVLFYVFCLASSVAVPSMPLRYLATLMPLHLLWFVLVGEAAGRHLAARGGERPAGAGSWRRQLPRIAFLVAAGIFLTNLGRQVETYRSETIPQYLDLSDEWREWRGFAETAAWLRAHTGADDVVASALDPFYFLHSGRRGVRYWFHAPGTYFYPDPFHAHPRIGTPAEILPELRRLGVRWLVREPLLYPAFSEELAADELAAAVVSSSAARATLVFRSADGQHLVYRLDW